MKMIWLSFILIAAAVSAEENTVLKLVHIEEIGKTPGRNPVYVGYYSDTVFTENGKDDLCRFITVDKKTLPAQANRERFIDAHLYDTPAVNDGNIPVNSDGWFYHLSDDGTQVLVKSRSGPGDGAIAFRYIWERSNYQYDTTITFSPLPR
ncbi:hypothetical protein [Breznakiella homolactica]|uniref:Uncharacterized protein n=1 Tax=Breznakiella homolactica TaxID=2798577 RepID=A0A7T7XR59_9SPIR|nr:hypothetical protein [Breznakiella homolactica]QQO10927.1 hypothetical protein JFL75_08420 [Breznakiella homolactica]